MTVFAGSGTGWLSGRLSRLMALKAFDVHHLLFFKLPLVDKILDYTGPLREKIMTEVTIGKFILMHPVREAGCPLADFLNIETIKKFEEKYPLAPLVVYVNSYAEAKMYADYIVTSASALRLISKLDDETVLFGPDKI